MNDWIDWGEQPTGPPPDPNQPWVWLGGQWRLIITDTLDEVPTDLSALDGEEKRP